MSKPTAPRAGASVPSPPRENLIRALSDRPELERAGSGMPTLTGHFAVWDTWTEIRSAFEGNFMERFSPGAMNKTLSEHVPKVLFQHGKDPQVGDKVLGIASRVEPDGHGAAYEVPLFDTSYNRDLIPALEAGAYGSSFRFSVLQEDVKKKPGASEYNPRGLPERTVTEARVAEFGPVTFPAYASATAGLRSLTDEFLLDRLLADEQLAERVAERVNDKRRVSVYFSNGAPGLHEDALTGTQNFAKYVAGNHFRPREAERLDPEDLSTLACMLQSGAQYIADQDEPQDQPNIPKMEAILADIAALVPVEVSDDEPQDEMNAEPVPAGDATRTPPDTEPEPLAATTRSRPSLFWFVADPTLEGANK